MPSWQKGNAGNDARARRGWIVGHFLDAGDLHHSNDVEVKWGVHPAGDERTEWAPGIHERTLLILVSGRWQLELAPEGHESSETIILDAPGDYVLWDQGIDHRWRAGADSVMITVRWPSLP